MLYTRGQITDFTDLVQNHLIADFATGDARIMVGASSILLEGWRPFQFADGGPISAADFVFN